MNKSIANNKITHEEFSVTNDSDGSVELIFGDSKFSLNQILVVENPEDEKIDFKGFLNNLGEEVTATFVDKCEIKEVDNEDVTISLVGNNITLPVKELEIQEETNTIKCIVIENDNETSEYEEEILRIEIESDDSNHDGIKLDSNNFRDVLQDVDEVPVQKDDLFDQEIRFLCNICGKSFEFLARLKAHKRRTHSTQVRVYTCEICGYQNNTLSGR